MPAFHLKETLGGVRVSVEMAGEFGFISRSGLSFN
jgi:hypothetical protein